MNADFDIRYIKCPITPLRGLTTVKNFYQNSGFQDVISSLPLPQPGSNMGYDPVDVVEGFLVSVILGARRLAHAGLLRYDKVVIEMFGWTKGMAGESTFSRFFKKFDLDLNDEVFVEQNRWWFTKLMVKHHTVDIDSTVIARYGFQDGVEVGYNPMSLYKIALIDSKHDPTLATMKFQCIAIASCLIRHSRTKTLVMSVNDRRQAFFDGLFQKIERIIPKSKFLLKKKLLMN